MVPPKIAAARITAAAMTVNFEIHPLLYSDVDGSNWRATSIGQNIPQQGRPTSEGANRGTPDGVIYCD